MRRVSLIYMKGVRDEFDKQAEIISQGARNDNGTSFPDRQGFGHT